MEAEGVGDDPDLVVVRASRDRSTGGGLDPSGARRCPRRSVDFVVLPAWQLTIRTSPGSVAPIPATVSAGSFAPSAGWPSDPCGEPSRAVGAARTDPVALVEPGFPAPSERDRRLRARLRHLARLRLRLVAGGPASVVARPVDESTRPPPEGEARRDRDDRHDACGEEHPDQDRRRLPRGPALQRLDDQAVTQSGRSRSSAGITSFQPSGLAAENRFGRRGGRSSSSRMPSGPTLRSPSRSSGRP